MVCVRNMITAGDGVHYPRKGDTVILDYTGFILNGEPGTDSEQRGNQFDTSIGRGEFICKIGEGRVIRGWDEGVLQMSLGEKAALSISSDDALGIYGFPGHVPPGANLMFEIELKGINEMKLAA